MPNATDVLVTRLCGHGQVKRAFRDHYDLPNLVSLWRSYVAREDKFNRYAEMTGHGPSHMAGVATLVASLSPQNGFLTDSEVFVLLAAAYLHDVGMFETQDRFYSRPMQIREMHGELSRERICRERHVLLPTLDDDAVELIATICSYHQGRAALSDAELWSAKPKKRLRFPEYLNRNYKYDGCPTDIDPLGLLEQPSLQRRLTDLIGQGRKPFSLAGVKQAVEQLLKDKQDKGSDQNEAEQQTEQVLRAPDVCPFLLATLLKFLDGCDYQASRTGSIEEVLRHASRNSSQAARSKLIMIDSASGLPTHRRASAEVQFFSSSVFHFARNLLIEQTLLLYDADRGRAEVVIKTADPDEIIDLCKRVVIPPGKQLSDAEPTLRETLELLQQYQADPRGTIISTLQVPADHGFVEEWDVAVPDELRGDRRTVHFLVAKRYVERELNAVSSAILSPTQEKEYYYCPFCPNRQECRLKHRAIPSFKDEKGHWNVLPFDAGVHCRRLAELPHLAPDEKRLAPPRGAYRERAVAELVEALRRQKQVILFGPTGRGKHVMARLASRKLTNNHAQHVFWHTVEQGEDQAERFVADLGDFLACNGDFALQNLIRGERVTIKHQDYAIRLLSLGRLDSGTEEAVFCIDGFNNLSTASREFFSKAIAFAICTNCSSASRCSKPDSERRGCPQARTFVLVISTKVPGQSWEQIPERLPVSFMAAPALDDSELSSFAANAFPEEPECQDAVRETWRRYGSEPVGIRMLEERTAAGWEGRQRVAWFAQDMADFFARNLTGKSLGSPVDLQVLKLVGLLQGRLTEEEIERIFPRTSAEDEGSLRKLIDRDLIRLVDGKLHAHAACDSDHFQRHWMDRVGDHPRGVLLRYVALGDNPAQVLSDRWAMVAPYLPQLQSLDGLAGGQHHTHTALAHSFRTLEILDRLVAGMEQVLPGYGEAIRGKLAEILRGRGSWPDMTRSCLLRLAALFHDIGKKHVYQEDQGRVCFHEHEKFGGESWSNLAKAAAMEGNQAQHVKAVIERHMHPLCLFAAPEVTDHAIKSLIQKAGEQLPEILLLFLADVEAGGTMDDRRDEAGRFVERILERAAQATAEQARPAAKRFTGTDLIQRLGLAPGRALGMVLKEVNRLAEEKPELTNEQLLDLARGLHEPEQAGGKAGEDKAT